MFVAFVGFRLSSLVSISMPLILLVTLKKKKKILFNQQRDWRLQFQLYIRHNTRQLHIRKTHLFMPLVAHLSLVIYWANYGYCLAAVATCVGCCWPLSFCCRSTDDDAWFAILLPRINGSRFTKISRAIFFVCFFFLFDGQRTVSPRMPKSTAEIATRIPRTLAIEVTANRDARSASSHGRSQEVRAHGQQRQCRRWWARGLAVG